LLRLPGEKVAQTELVPVAITGGIEFEEAFVSRRSLLVFLRVPAVRCEAFQRQLERGAIHDSRLLGGLHRALVVGGCLLVLSKEGVEASCAAELSLIGESRSLPLFEQGDTGLRALGPLDRITEIVDVARCEVVVAVDRRAPPRDLLLEQRNGAALELDFL